MVFICSIIEVKICVSLRIHPDVRIAENDAAAWLGPNRMLFLTVTFLQTNLKIMYIRKNRKINILIRNTLRELFA